jgi:molybdate transport system substrate-binding protein
MSGGPSGWRVALVAACVSSALLAACGTAGRSGERASDGSGSPSVAGQVTVFAAASLTEAFTTLGARFERQHPGTTVQFSFGPSSGLAEQISAGAPADVLASADTATMDRIVRQGRAARSTVFATNELEIAVPAGNPAHVQGLADLTRSAVKVALCQPQVPCGSLAAQAFHRAGVTVRPVTLEADVKSVLAKVSLGEVDAGVVYVTDVRAAGDAVTGIPIPAAVNTSTQYPIAALTDAPNAVTASAFVAYVMSDAGRSALAAAGFSAP